METIDEIKTNNAIIRKHRSGIVSLFHPDNQKVSTITDIKTNYEALLKIQKGKISPFLLIANNVSTVEPEAKVFMTKTLPNIANSMAMVSRNPLTRITVNFYLYLHAPALPTKAFNSEEKAVEWLKQYGNED